MKKFEIDILENQDVQYIVTRINDEENDSYYFATFCVKCKGYVKNVEKNHGLFFKVPYLVCDCNERRGVILVYGKYDA